MYLEIGRWSSRSRAGGSQELRGNGSDSTDVGKGGSGSKVRSREERKDKNRRRGEKRDRAETGPAGVTKVPCEERQFLQSC